MSLNKKQLLLLWLRMGSLKHFFGKSAIYSNIKFIYLYVVIKLQLFFFS